MVRPKDETLHETSPSLFWHKELTFKSDKSMHIKSHKFFMDY